MATLKARFLFGLLFILFSNCFAQRLKYDDLLYGINHSLSEIEDYVLDKGLSFDRSDNLIESIKSYSFSRDSNNPNYIAYSVDVFGTYVSYIVSCSITTMRLEEYQQLRALVKNAGYKRVDSGLETADSMLFSYYHKDDYEVCFSIYNLGDNQKMYSVSISDVRRRNIIYAHIEDDRKAADSTYDSVAYETKMKNVYQNTSILATPDIVNGKVVGKVKDGRVRVLEKINDKYYKVESGAVTGYFFITWFIDKP
ncbi:MAG: hypothetical protein EAS52_01665 [Parapedobacter sp.]|nr:MAG: hypothetical protein EAS52_01665 [Parapedobacter sp.]